MHISMKNIRKYQGVKEFHLLGCIGYKMSVSLTYVLSYVCLCPLCLLLCLHYVPSYVPYVPSYAPHDPLMSPHCPHVPSHFPYYVPSHVSHVPSYAPMSPPMPPGSLLYPPMSPPLPLCPSYVPSYTSMSPTISPMSPPMSPCPLLYPLCPLLCSPISPPHLHMLKCSPPQPITSQYCKSLIYIKS